jgi:hypothetical protein
MGKTSGSRSVVSVLASLAFLATMTSAPRAHAQDLAPPPTGNAGDAPPPPATTQPPPAHTDSEEKKEEKKDSGHGLEWVFLNADAGFSYINMTSISSSNLNPSTVSNASQGPKFGVGAGVRLFILTLGVHANLNELSMFNLYQFDGELGFHIPIGHFEPYLGLHGGYCFVGSLSDAISNTANLSITGGDVGAQLGFEYYFNHFVSIGIEGAASAYFLQRPATTLPASAAAMIPAADQALYQQSGDSVGFGASGMFHVGFHL